MPTRPVTETSPAAAIAQQLIGKWVLAGWDYSMRFAADGRMVRNVEGQETSGTFNINPEGARLMIDYADGTTLNTAFVLNPDTLVLTMDDPNGSAKEPITLMRSLQD